MISIQNVSKFILSDVNVYIPKGVVVGLIGSSGAGKTTLLKLACGLLESEKGSVKTFGMNPVKERKKLSLKMRSYFSDRFFFQGDDTVIEQFRLLQNVYCMNQEKYWDEYHLLAERLKFSEYEGKRVDRLSLGERRRAELAFMLMGNQELLLFDEPTNGLDELGKLAFWEQIEKKKKEGATILISSHNMTEVQQLCDRILLIDEGKILYYGDGEQLMRRYAPINQIEVRYTGMIPDMDDLPLLRYSIEGDFLKLEYNSNHVSAAEIMQRIMEQTPIVRVNIIRQNLADVILRRKEKSENELFD